MQRIMTSAPTRRHKNSMQTCGFRQRPDERVIRSIKLKAGERKLTKQEQNKKDELRSQIQMNKKI